MLFTRCLLVGVDGVDDLLHVGLVVEVAHAAELGPVLLGVGLIFDLERAGGGARRLAGDGGAVELVLRELLEPPEAGRVASSAAEGDCDGLAGHCE